MARFNPKKILTFIFFFLLIFLTLPYKVKAQPTSTEPEFKVAFIGDSGAGSNFQQVLNLIKQEGAQMVLHQGDFAYSDGQSNWENMINQTLGSNFPYLGSDGNHDSWSSYAPFFKDRLSKMGLDPNIISSSGSDYTTVYKGLKMVFVKENGDPSFVNSAFQGYQHIWRICSWHKNMNSMQVGSKGDEMSWSDYENCKNAGAIIVSGHEHTYERTKTLTNTQNQTVDPTCSDPGNLCVSPGRTFVVVSGLGGKGIRNQDRCLPSTYPYGCNGEWASIYTSDQNADYGALFITFYYQGNPNRAHGYFKNINGQTIDEFDILATSGNPPSQPPSTITNPPTTPTSGGEKPGDTNNDNIVDGLDYVVWLNHYNQSATGASFGDFNNNGFVDGLDYVIWLNNYNK